MIRAKAPPVSTPTKGLEEISLEIEAFSRTLISEALGVTAPSDAFLLALDAWSALERQACLTWLEHPEIAREAIEDLLLSSFDCVLAAVGRHGPATADVLAAGS